MVEGKKRKKNSVSWYHHLNTSTNNILAETWYLMWHTHGHMVGEEQHWDLTPEAMVLAHVNLSDGGHWYLLIWYTYIASAEPGLLFDI